MSPEYQNWNYLPKNLQELVKEMLGKDFVKKHANSGFAFLMDDDGIRRVAELKALTQGILNDAKKESSPWHVVKGMFDPKKRTREFEKQNPKKITLQPGRIRHRGSTSGRPGHANRR